MRFFLAFVAVIAAFFGFVTWYEARPARVAERAAEAAQRDADKKPRKVSEASGCETWAFKPSDRWLYFARCDAKTSTTNTWDVCRSVTTGKTTRTECTPHSATVEQAPR